jgi:glycosyltransferase involved in cell wall biosynthesis
MAATSVQTKCGSLREQHIEHSDPSQHVVRVAWMSCVESGDDSRAIALQKAALDCGFDVSFICTSAGNLAGVNYRVVGPITSFFWHNIGLVGSIKALLGRLRKTRKVFSTLWQLKPDIVITQEPDSWLLGVIYKALHKARLVNDLQEIYEDRCLAFPRVIQGVIRSSIRNLMKLCAEQSDAIIHVSDARCALYSDFASPAVTVSLYPPAELSDTWSRSTGPPRGETGWGDRFVMVHAGALRPSYAGNELIQALLKLESLGNLDFLLVVLGGVHGALERAPLDGLIERGRIEVHEQVPHSQVYRFIAASDVGLNIVLPLDLGHIYAQPRKLYEYMALGVPVIGSDVPTIADVVRMCDCGWMVNAADPDSIVSAIIAAANNLDTARQKGENGRSGFQRKFNWEAESRAFQNLLRQLSVQ